MRIFAFILAIAVSVVFSSTAEAGTNRKSHHPVKKHSYAKSSAPSLFYPSKYAALAVDADSGTILQQANADAVRYPASLAKLMTLYLSFEALEDKRLNPGQYVKVSRHAAAQPRMSLALRTSSQITVKTLIESVVVLSANDSAVVLAESIAGTESEFARLMTSRARQLGMSKTTFANASGLHNPKQVTTAKDMAKLMMALKRDFPQYYNLLSLTSFSYNKQDFGTHNRLMQSYNGAKAGKTGFINASGFNLVLNAEKNGKDVVGVVMGGITAKARDDRMRAMLDTNFAKLASSSATNKYASNYVGSNKVLLKR